MLMCYCKVVTSQLTCCTRLTEEQFWLFSANYLDRYGTNASFGQLLEGLFSCPSSRIDAFDGNGA
jgi:hypothetical protein